MLGVVGSAVWDERQIALPSVLNYPGSQPVGWR